MTNTLLTRHDPAEAKLYHSDGTWGDETHYRLLTANAATRPMSNALRDGERRINWSQLLTWVDVVAADLANHDRELGLGIMVELLEDVDE